MSEPVIIICSRVASVPAKLVETESRVLQCATCKADIWVASSSIDLIAKDPLNTSLSCLECIPRNAEIAGLVPE